MVSSSQNDEIQQTVVESKKSHLDQRQIQFDYLWEIELHLKTTYILIVVEGRPRAVGGVGVVPGARGGVGRGGGGGGAVTRGGGGVGAPVRVPGHRVHHVEQGQTEEQLQQYWENEY